MKKFFLLLVFFSSIFAFARTADQVLRMPHTGNIPAYGQVDLSQSAAVKNQLGVANGGTGLSSCTSGTLVSGGGSGAMSCGANNVNIPGKAVTENSQMLVVSQTNPSTTSLAVIRGGSSTSPSSGNCGTAIGEGYSCSRTSTGVYVITFTTAFADTPVCTVSTALGGATANLGGTSNAPTTTTLTFNSINVVSGSAADGPFGFICLGQRP